LKGVYVNLCLDVCKKIYKKTASAYKNKALECSLVYNFFVKHNLIDLIEKD